MRFSRAILMYMIFSGRRACKLVCGLDLSSSEAGRSSKVSPQASPKRQHLLQVTISPDRPVGSSYPPHHCCLRLPHHCSRVVSCRFSALCGAKVGIAGQHTLAREDVYRINHWCEAGSSAAATHACEWHEFEDDTSQSSWFLVLNAYLVA